MTWSCLIYGLSYGTGIYTNTRGSICTHEGFTMPRCFVSSVEINYFEFLNKNFAYYRSMTFKIGSACKYHKEILRSRSSVKEKF